jgi:zinc protease
MQLDEVKAAFKSLAPDEAAVIAVGGAGEAEVIARLTTAFNGWKRAIPADARPKVEVPQERPRLVMVNYPEKPQAMLLVGQPAVPRSSPDYLPLTLLNSVLGGSFTSRLNQNLREAHGYTYGSGSRFSFGVDRGPFYASAQVKTEVTGPALKEMLFEIGRAVREPLSEADLAKGRALLAYDLVEMLEHSSAAAAGFASIFLYDLPLDEYRTMVDRLKAVTVKDVQAAAARALQPEKMIISIAGDMAAVEPQLKAEAALALPPPEIRDAEGKLAPAPVRSATR